MKPRPDSKPKKDKPDKKCPYCGSKDTYAMRGSKGSHWHVCNDCNEEF